LPEIGPHIRLARLPQNWLPVLRVDDAMGQVFCLRLARFHHPGNDLVKKTPFRLTPYQVQWLLVVGFATVGYALYVRYFAIEFSGVALACDAGLQTMLCKSRLLATYLFRHSVFGIVALIIATLHVIRPSIVLLTGGLIVAGLGVVLYNLGLSGIAIGLLILGFARPAPATA
jgi:hypothetical protein